MKIKEVLNGEVLASAIALERFVKANVERIIKEARIEERLAEFGAILGFRRDSFPPSPASTPARPAKKSAAQVASKRKQLRKPASQKPRKTASATKRPSTRKPEAHKVLLAALEEHPRRQDLLRAGKAPNQLLRSLIPLYFGGPAGVVVTSGVTSKFWKSLGVTYAAPNAAKVLRQHKDLAQRTSSGVRLSAQGRKYVEDALRNG